MHGRNRIIATFFAFVFVLLFNLLFTFDAQAQRAYREWDEAECYLIYYITTVRVFRQINLVG